MRRKKRRKKGATRRRWWWRRRRRRRRRGRRDDAVVSPGARGARSGLALCRPRPGAPHMPGPFLPGLGPFPPRGPLGPGASAAAVCGPGAAARADGAPRFLAPHRVSPGGDSDTAFALLSPPLRSRSGNVRNRGDACGGLRSLLLGQDARRAETRVFVPPSPWPPRGKRFFPQPRRSVSRCDHAGSFSRFGAGDPGPLVPGGSPSPACCPWSPPLPAAPGSAPDRQTGPCVPPARRRGTGVLVHWMCRAVTLLAVRNNEV